MLRQAGEDAPRSRFSLRSDSIESCTYVGIYARPRALPTKPNFRDGRIHQDDLPSERYFDSPWGADVDCSPSHKSPSRLWLTSRKSTASHTSTARIQRCLIDLAEYDQAAETFERVLELDGENIIALQTLTWMADHRNDIVDPRRGRLVKMHPTNAEARLVQQGLDEFQEAPAKRRRMRSGE